MSFYVTIKDQPAYEQISIEELLFGDDFNNDFTAQIPTSTRTYKLKHMNKSLLRFCKHTSGQGETPIENLISKLDEFNYECKKLREIPREDLYNTFYISKHSGGLRRIDAPNAELMNALRKLKTIFEDDFNALYHTSAFAYIKKRSTIDAIKRHQQNGSNWYGKFDLSNFFGSTTIEFVMNMLSMIFPFSEVVKTQHGKDALGQALELAFLNGGLPQGTPFSPLITNVMMIPIDFKLSNTLRAFPCSQSNNNDETEIHQRFIYTRYADDFLISSRHEFNINEIENFIVDTLSEFNAPFTLNSKKSRYGSRAGRNWNLGIMVNKDNNLTVGHKKKKQFQNMLAAYIMDKQNGKVWDKNDVRIMEGYRNYYRMIEGDVIDKIIEHIANKFGAETIYRKNGLNLASVVEDLSQ